jgi:hypothetical protein
MAKQQPVPVLRWSPTLKRRIEHIRDRIMRGLGTDEPLIPEDIRGIAHHWRKPLSIPEINQMAPTPEVRERRGRP